VCLSDASPDAFYIENGVQRFDYKKMEITRSKMQWKDQDEGSSRYSLRLTSSLEESCGVHALLSLAYHVPGETFTVNGCESEATVEQAKIAYSMLC
jgi:hypothetical protein